MKNRIYGSVVRSFFLLLMFPVLFSCGSGSSSGGEKEFEFSPGQMVDKMWYRNVWIDNRSGNEYDLRDGLEVIQFDADGRLRQIEYSGLRNQIVGNWELDGNKLILDYSGKEDEVWYVIKPSSDKYLKLQNDYQMEFVSEIPDLEGVAADARIIRETYNDNGYKEGYRYGFELLAKGVKEAWVLTENSDKIDLVEVQSGVFAIGEEDAKKHFTEYEFHEERVRFVLKFESGFQTILDEVVYNKAIGGLDHQNVVVTYRRQNSEVNIEFPELEGGEDIYYQIHLLGSDKDENKPVYVSYPLQGKDGQVSFIASRDKTGMVKEWDRLSSGMQFYVKVMAYNYEPDVEHYDLNSRNNIQSISQFITIGGEW